MKSALVLLFLALILSCCGAGTKMTAPDLTQTGTVLTPDPPPRVYQDIPVHVTGTATSTTPGSGG